VVLLHRERPFYIDLTATCLYAVTGALLAIRRHYDVVGLFVLALVSGVGGWFDPRRHFHPEGTTTRDE
jgi:Glycine transporter